jgi:hypothetical protein
MKQPNDNLVFIGEASLCYKAVYLPDYFHLKIEKTGKIFIIFF